jgi:hypothetical protein
MRLWRYITEEDCERIGRAVEAVGGTFEDAVDLCEVLERSRLRRHLAGRCTPAERGAAPGHRCSAGSQRQASRFTVLAVGALRWQPSTRCCWSGSLKRLSNRTPGDRRSIPLRWKTCEQARRRSWAAAIGRDHATRRCHSKQSSLQRPARTNRQTAQFQAKKASVDVSWLRAISESAPLSASALREQPLQEPLGGHVEA